MRILITGCAGLIGSEAVAYFGRQGHTIVGVDNNQRRSFFGAGGDTSRNIDRLLNEAHKLDFVHADIRDREKMMDLYRRGRPEATIHCAAQPSHDLAATIPFEDFETNAVGTLNLLEASRQFTREAPFVHLSTNKVYGDAPNERPLIELPTRWEFADAADWNGINEDCRIDRTKHSLFGASKAAADILVQEYGRYFDMPTVCFRGGCLTGPHHAAVELHGFLAYLVRVAVDRKPYTIFGYKGKQVRDQLHSRDVVRAAECFLQHPRSGAVYNLGGGRENSASVLECIALIKEILGLDVDYSIVDRNRIGDHICYISDLRRFKADYPAWTVEVSLAQMITEIHAERRES